MNNILDEEGENIAVRMFLSLYGGNAGVTCGEMLNYLTNCGYPYAPYWVIEQRNFHLTKAGAQLWLRYLFSLENL